jgi:hypothetical protein
MPKKTNSKRWTSSDAQEPRFNQLCDFMFAPSMDCREVWMLCRSYVTAARAYHHSGVDLPYLWRPAERLPRALDLSDRT